MSEVRHQSTSTPSWQECLDAGMTAREAAEARGMSVFSAYHWARAKGVAFSAAKPGRKAGSYTINLDRYRELAATGHSKATTAALMGVSHQRVCQIALRHGIEFEIGYADRELDEAVASLHGEGLHDAEIARRLGRGKSSVTRARTRLGLTAHSAPTWEARIRECAEAGLTLSETGRFLGLSAQNVWSMAKKWGVTFHVKHRRRQA